MTKTAQHSLLFKLWIKIRGLLAILIIIFGILVGLISLILPNDNLYKSYLTKIISQQLGKQVEIGKISGKWKGFGPKFSITDLVVKDKDEVSVQQATLYVNIFKYIAPKGSTGIYLGVSDISVDFVESVTGEIILTQKDKLQQSLSEKLDKILSTGTLSINNLSLNIQKTNSDEVTSIKSSIKVQQTEAKRAFEMQLDSKDLADEISIKAITEKSHDFMQQAQWYIQSKDLSLQALRELSKIKFIPKAFVDLEIWADTESGNIIKMLAQAEFKDKIFTDDAEITGSAELVYIGDKHNWNTFLTIKDIETESISQEQINIDISRSNNILELKADILDIRLLKAITHVLGVAYEEFDELELKGKLNDVKISYDLDLRRIVEGDINFEQLNLKSSFANLTNLAGNIRFHNDQIRLIVDSETGTAELPTIMRGKIEWNELFLTAQTSMQDEDLDIKINSLWCECNDFIIDGTARINYNDDLFLDLGFGIYNAQVNQLYKYWPSNIWKPKLLKFLDQALVTGEVERGMILYHGLVKNIPFKSNQGIFTTSSHLKNATVKYHKHWPLLTQFSADVTTTNNSLIITSKKGKSLDTYIKNVYAEIKNLKKPYLTISIAANGNDNFLVDYLKESPMTKNIKILKEDISLIGKQEIDVDLSFSLKTPNPRIIPTGRINFLKTTFQLGQFQMQRLNGSMAFDGFSLNLDKIKADFLNQQVNVSGSILNQPNQNSNINIQINGNYDVNNFETALGFSLPANGRSSWQFNISNNGTQITSFSAKSNLVGTSLDMPEPLNKLNPSQAPFSIKCVLPCTDSSWEINYDDKISTNFTIDENKDLQINNLIFGETVEQFGGKLDNLDVDKWLDLLSKKPKKTDKALPFEDMTLQVKQLKFMSRILNNVTIIVIKNPTDIQLNITGSEIQGKIIISDNLVNKGIIVQLDKLHWQAPDKSDIIETSSKISSKYPALHIWIGDFIYDGIPLGEASIEIRPVSNGLRVEKIITKSELLNLNINGEWIRNLGKNGLSKFNVIITSKDIAKFLTNLGFQAPISQADTLINMQAEWNDFPSQFEIKNISGSMRIEIGKGEVIDAKPGMGRVLGLFSLTNLPRRLILDFRDVFGKGLHFSSMQGNFNLMNGDAFTDSFLIDSSSAKIFLSGKTGMANQDYDQTIIVEPRVGRILPTIGAIAGGAVGAAAGFLVQGMFHKGLKNIGKIIYRVTGSWDEPKIELIETYEK